MTTELKTERKSVENDAVRIWEALVSLHYPSIAVQKAQGPAPAFKIPSCAPAIKRLQLKRSF